MNDIPPQPQRQDSLNDQLRDVINMANKMGCYDASDFIQKILDEPRVGRYNSRAGFHI